MRKRDFFFGEVYEGSGGATLRLSDMEPLARKVSAEFFTAQLNRILKEHDGQLTLSDGTSYRSACRVPSLQRRSKRCGL